MQDKIIYNELSSAFKKIKRMKTIKDITCSPDSSAGYIK